ncbi:hypothetical protein BDZ94DRAFT_1241478 [Collybia nuda]|uniref:Uncharacterized protein n=1 Tax=Collybia nuda TaxID=64659 RepID=A0A9P6CBX1_9AGAR|nr:hypothetical protein BDZ94DRAFT_1241478 [Collybia nuda]
MRLAVVSLSTLLVVLSSASQADALLCLLAQLLTLGWVRCRYGWSHGGTIGPAPTPPINCGPGTYVYGGTTCLPAMAVCNAPNNEIFAHPNRECGCQAPGTGPIAPRIPCLAIDHSRATCTTASNGQSSSCGIECDTGFTFTTVNGQPKCLPADLTVCPAGEQVASGPMGEGCADGDPCGDAIVSDNSGDPHGRMICKLDGTAGNSRCVQDCDPGHIPQGNRQCVPQP